MKSVSQKDLLENLTARIEEHKTEVLRHFQNLDEEVLLKASSTGGWSIVQCLDHLNSYGDYYLPEIKERLKKAPKNEGVDLFRSSWLGAYFIRMMEPSTGTKKYKAFKGHIPGERPDAAATISEFLKQQDVLMALVEISKEKDLNRVRIPVSITGLIRLKLGDVFQFITAHNARHLIQAKRNLIADHTILPLVNK